MAIPCHPHICKQSDSNMVEIICNMYDYEYIYMYIYICIYMWYIYIYTYLVIFSSIYEACDPHWSSAPQQSNMQPLKSLVHCPSVEAKIGKDMKTHLCWEKGKSALRAAGRVKTLLSRYRAFWFVDRLWWIRPCESNVTELFQHTSSIKMHQVAGNKGTNKSD